MGRRAAVENCTHRRGEDEKFLRSPNSARAHMGRYISEDPIGLAGGVENFAYVHNPFAWVDQFGLSGSCGKPNFPNLKDHAARHSELSPRRYYDRALAHSQSALALKVWHDGSFKQAFISRLGPNQFRYTAMNLNRTTIFTHMDVTTDYLRNIGLLLPHGF